MTVQIQTPINTYTGNGTTKIFPYTFKLASATDLQVSIQGVIQSTGFTISNIGNNTGGNVTFAKAPSNGAKVQLKRSTSLERNTDYITGGMLDANVLDADVDRVVLMIQDLRRDVGEGTIFVPESMYINIKHYGAVGNGITDDTDAIQDAIDNADGKGLFIPEGTFLVSSLAIPSNTTISGYGSSSILKMMSNQPNGTWIVKNNNFVGGNSNIRLQNFVLDGNDDNQTLGFNNTCTQFQNVSGLVLKDLIVKNGISEGIYIYNCDNAVVLDNRCEGNGPYRGDASGIHLESCNGAIVANNQSNNNGFHGIILTGVTNSVIANNVCTGNGYEGVRCQFGTNNNTFVGNSFVGNGRNGMYFLSGSDDNVITSNILSSNENDGIAFYEAKKNRLTSNQIKSNLNNGVETVDLLDVQIFSNNDISSNVVNNIYNDGGAVQIFENDFSQILNKPTTLAGYGITDAALSSHNHDSLYQPVGDYSVNGHHHDTQYADISHFHDSEYADINHNHTLASLLGVSLTSPSNNQALVYNGTNWVNQTLSYGNVYLANTQTFTGANTFSNSSSGTAITKLRVGGSNTEALTGTNLAIAGSFLFQDSMLSDSTGNELANCVDLGATLTSSGSVTNPGNVFKYGNTYSTLNNTTLPIVIEVTKTGLIGADTSVTAQRVFLQAHGNLQMTFSVEVQGISGTWYTLADNVSINIFAKQFWFSNPLSPALAYPSEWPGKGLRLTITALSAATAYIRCFGIFRPFSGDIAWLNNYDPTFNGEMLGPAGTAAVPAYSFFNDLDTGIYRPGSDQISIAGGGKDILRLTGTTSAVNYATLNAGNTGVAPTISVAGTDTNISMSLTAKGTGTINLNSNVVLSGTITGDGSGLNSINADNISTGTLSTARLGSGTANNSTFLRGDGTWAVVSASGIPITCRTITTQVSSTTSLANATNLVFTGLTEWTYYHFRFCIVFQTVATTTGIKLGLTYPNVSYISAKVDIPVAADGTGGSLQGWITSSGDSVTGTGVQAANTNYMATIEGMLYTSGTGDLQVQFASEVASSNVTIMDGSTGFLINMGT